MAARDDSPPRRESPPPQRNEEIENRNAQVTEFDLAQNRAEFASEATNEGQNPDRVGQEEDQETRDDAHYTGRIKLLENRPGYDNPWKSKHDSAQFLVKQRSASFRSRKLVVQRDPKYLDPLNRYAQGTFLTEPHKFSFSPLASDEEAPENMRQLTRENETSVNVNWNYGGVTVGSDRRRIPGDPQGRTQRNPIAGQLYLDGMDETKAAAWKAAMAAPRVDAGGSLAGRNQSVDGNTLRWSSLYPTPSVTRTPFNMAQGLKTLAGISDRPLFRNYAHVLEYFPRNIGSQIFQLGRDNPTTYKGMIVYQHGRVREGQRYYDDEVSASRQIRSRHSGRADWIPGFRMKRILQELGYSGGPHVQYNQLAAQYPVFALETGMGNRDDQPAFNRRPYAGYNNSLHALFVELKRTGMAEARILELAEACLSTNERRALYRPVAPIKYDFFDFETTTGFVLDSYTSLLNTGPGVRSFIVDNLPYSDSISGSIEDYGAAEGKATYVRTVPNYESSIEENNIPEAALPNLYVYQLAARQGTLAGIEGRGWDNTIEQNELFYNYDRLIRLDEFLTGTLPGLQEGTKFTGERGSTLDEYLEAYGNAVKGRGVVIDVVSNLARSASNVVTKPELVDDDLYSKYNELKYNFPMFTELRIPMIEMGDLSPLLDDLPPTSMVNSVLDVDSKEYKFTVSSYGIVANEGTDELNDEEDDAAMREPTVIRKMDDLKVISGSAWLDNMRRSLRPFSTENSITTLQFRPSPDAATAQAWITALETEINEEAEQRMVLYKDFLTGEKTVCDSETIMFKLVKKDPSLPAAEQILQNYFFPNTSKKYIDFIDTQVKYNKEYQYELYAYDVVYGSTFEFRNRAAIYPDRRVDREDMINQLAFFSFNVDTKPKPVIVEYPLIVTDWRIVEQAALGNTEQYRTHLGGGLATSLARRRPDEFVGGVSYPRLKIIDYPPLPPEVSLFSYKNTDNKLLVNMAPGVGEYLEKDALPWISFDDEEEALLRSMSNSQRSYNSLVPRNKIQYKETNGPVKMLIYRTEVIETNVATYEDLYKSFSGKLHKTLDIADMATSDAALAYDFLDDLEPNTKYYYTFRTMNYRDQFSNPTDIYEVELVSDQGFMSTYIQEYVPPITTEKTPTKKMVRYLEVKAADLQSLPFQEASQAAGFAASRTGYFSSKRSLIDNVGQNGVVPNTFVVRLTSRDTGRKIDIEVKFKKSEKTIN